MWNLKGERGEGRGEVRIGGGEGKGKRWRNCSESDIIIKLDCFEGRFYVLIQEKKS